MQWRREILLMVGHPLPKPKFFLLTRQIPSRRGLHTECLEVEALGRKSGDQDFHPSTNTNQLRNSQTHSKSWAVRAPISLSRKRGFKACASSLVGVGCD